MAIYTVYTDVFLSECNVLQYVTVYMNYYAGWKLLGEKLAWPPLNRNTEINTEIQKTVNPD